MAVTGRLLIKPCEARPMVKGGMQNVGLTIDSMAYLSRPPPTLGLILWEGSHGVRFRMCAPRGQIRNGEVVPLNVTTGRTPH